MCGRIVLKAPARQVAQEFAVAEPAELAPRHNIAPTQPVTTVVLDAAGARVLQPMQWGLIPPWGRDLREGARLFNARAETVTAKPAFREAFATRRCLIPADGFYEWRRHGRERQPFYFHSPDGRLLALAGVWSRWEYPGGEVVDSCSVLTTDANDLMRPIHHRMPVLLALADHDRWLLTRPDDATSLLALLQPAPPSALHMHAVSPLVNRAANDGPELIAPVTPPGPRQLGLFG